jgi:eukaryotic-like serine/threonine-protein kinase
MDRDFLFGVLAVQLGQATPQQVMAAASAYVVDQSRSVADNLMAAGAISEERRRMLDGMVDEALKVHGGDVHKTMQSIGGDRAILASFGGSLVVDDTGNVSLAAPHEDGGESIEDFEAVTPEADRRYRVEPNAEVGRGGIGRVLVALDQHLGREIAVKELLASTAGSSHGSPGTDAMSRTGALAARFLREARVTGQLEHPNIVPVYEVGKRADGTFYYTMKLVRGRTLAQALREALNLQGRLKLLHHYVDLCNAVAYAHSRGVIHRDIKTENVMLGEFGETVVLDWGLAKVKGKKDIRSREIERELKLLQDAGTGKTVDGSAIGTPAYMSPEQAEGAIDEIDERSDVWSLGAVLYELLTGKPPFEGVTPYEIIGKVLKDEIVAPRDKSEEIPAELSAVAVKALSRDKSRRYERAGDLADEINAFMSGGRIAAYEYSSWELVRSFVAKNRAASALAAAITVLLIAGGASLYVAYREAGEERDRAEAQQARAEQERQRAHKRETAAHHNLATALDAKAVQLIKAKRTLSARVFAAASLLHNPVNPKSPFHVADAHDRFPQADALFTSAASVVYQATSTNIATVQRIFRADGDFQRLEVSNDTKRLVSVSLDQDAYVWSVDSGKLAYELDGTAFASFSPDSHSLVTVTTDGKALLRDATTGKERGAIPVGSSSYTAAGFTPDGSMLVTTNAGFEAELRSTDTLKAVKKVAFKRGPKEPKSIWFAVREGFLIGSYQNDELRIFDLRSAEWVSTLRADRRTYNPGISADGSTLALGHVDWTTSLWNTATGKRLHLLQGHREAVDAVTMTPDARLLATGSGDRTIGLWNVEAGTSLAVLEGHKDPVRDVQFSVDGERLFSSSSDKTVRAWELDSDPPAAVLAGHGARIWRVAFSPDGRLLASASGDRTARLWDVRSKTLLAKIGGFDNEVMSVAFSPDGGTLAASSSDHQLRLIDPQSGTVTELLSYHDAYLSGVTFSPDGRLLATSGLDERLVLYDLAQKRVVRSMKRHKSHGESSFSPDGKRIATAAKGRKINVYRVEDGKLLAQLEGHPDDTFNVQYSHDGRHIVSTGRGGHVLVWNAATFKLERELVGHERWVNTAKYSPDDKWIATGSDEQKVRVWDAATGETMLVIHVDAEGFCADFSPDGKTLAVIDGRDIRLYPLDFSVREAEPKKLLADAEEAASMRLEGFALVTRAPEGK